MVRCDICHKETDVGTLVHGFFACDEECANIANEPNNFDLIQKAIRQGFPVL